MGKTFQPPPESAEEWVNERLDKFDYCEAELSSLLRFSGFPEALLSGSKRFHNKWRDDYIDRFIRENIRDLTNIRELENVAVLTQFLPSKVSSPLSINSLTKDIKCSFATVSNYLSTLELGYMVFRTLPFIKKKNRTFTNKREKTLFHRLDKDPIRGLTL